KRRRYTNAKREAAVRDAAKIGVCAAARKHGIPQSCVSRWLGASMDGGKGPTETATKRRAAEPDSSEATVDNDRGRAAKRYTPSQRAEILEYASAHGVSKAAAKHKVSRFSIYEWRRKVAKAATGGGSAPTTGAAQSDVEAQRDQEIMAEWRRHPGLGPSQIRNQLRRQGIKVSVHTVRRVMEDAGYRPPKVKREPHDQRYEAVRPNHLWHLDFVHRHINRSSTFTLILIDDFSRFVVGHGVDDAERADFVIKTFEQAVERHGRP